MSRITASGLALPGCFGTDALVMGGSTPPWDEPSLFEPIEGAPSIAAEVSDFSLKDMGLSVKSYLDRTTSLALAACSLALGKRRDEKMGLSYASRWGCLSSMKLFYAKVRTRPRVAPPLPFSHSYVNSSAAVAAIEFGLAGFHAVYSGGRSCSLDALIAAAAEVEESGMPSIVLAADSLGSERYALYAENASIGEPSEDEPARGVPSEGAVALLVEPEGTGGRVVSWCRPGRVDDNPLRPILEERLGKLPEKVYTDASTTAEAEAYERSLENAEFTHLGLILGNAESALPLACVAKAAAGTESILCLSGGPEEPVAVTTGPGETA